MNDQKEQDRQFELLVISYETGRISSQQFREAIRNHYQVPPTDAAIDEAWNALLLNIPPPRIKLLEDLRKTYRIFLLSNSNEIHYLKYLHDFCQKYGYAGFDDLFEKAYFSFQVHLSKPDPSIFRLVLEDSNLLAAETLFIDDTLIHVESAERSGITGYHLKEGEDLVSLFQ
jgi:putative hydrolase of the HAD superfamily